MKQHKIPSLEYALLGLLQGKPASGYDVRKIFSSTSMKTYSDSPGAIYPALRRLERRGFIRGTIEEGAGLRRRQIFRVTSKGTAELRNWITHPVTADDLVHGQQDVMLRFAFSEYAVGREASVALLKSLEESLGRYLQGLRTEFEALKKVAPLSGRLAFECGLRGAEGLLEWTQYAIRSYAK
jgi:DNA-binding PadR family transcriptional regulator